MKTVKYKLTAKTPKLTMVVTDILGKEYTVDRTSKIYDYSYPEVHYDIEDMTPDSIKHVFLKHGGSDGIQVAPDVWVRVAKVHFTGKEMVEVTKIVELEYWWFKPKLKYTSRITCEEVPDGAANSTTA